MEPLKLREPGHDDLGLHGGRHDRIRDKIFQQAQLASLNPTKERPHLIAGSIVPPTFTFPTGLTEKELPLM